LLKLSISDTTAFEAPIDSLRLAPDLGWILYQVVLKGDLILHWNQQKGISSMTTEKINLLHETKDNN